MKLPPPQNFPLFWEVPDACTQFRYFRYVLGKHYVTEDFPFYLPQVNYYSAERKPPALLDGRKGRNRENGSSFCPLPFLLSSSL